MNKNITKFLVGAVLLAGVSFGVEKPIEFKNPPVELAGKPPAG